MIHSESIQQKSTGDMAARVISDVFNPLTLPLLVFGVAGLTTDASLKFITEILGVTTLLFFIIPFLAAVTITKVKRDTTLDFHSRSIRSVLYLISIVSIGLGGFYFFNEIYFETYRVFLVIYLVNLVAALGINFKWKASVHVGSLVTASILLSWLGTFDATGVLPIVIALIIISFLPLLAWARIQLKVHSWFEILLGVVTGFISTSLMILLLV